MAKKKAVKEPTELEKLLERTRRRIQMLLESTGAMISDHTRDLVDQLMDSIDRSIPDPLPELPGHDAIIREYHFSVGDSSFGPIGLVAVVGHYSAKQALDFLLEHLPEEMSWEDSFVAKGGHEPHIAYIKAYVNEEAFSLRDIEEVEDVEDDGGEEEDDG